VPVVDGPGAAWAEQGDELLRAYTTDKAVAERAAAAYREAIRREPGAAGGYKGLARALGTLGDFPAEVAAAREAAERFPRDAEAQFLLAMALGDVGDFPAAVGAFDQAAALEPTMSHLATQRSWTLLQMGELDRAVADAKAGAARDPEDAFAARQLGDALYAAGRFAEAAPAYTRAIALEPSGPWGYKRLADTYHALDQYPQALATLEGAAARFPDHLVLAIDLGVSLQKNGRREAALGQLAKAEGLAARQVAMDSGDVEAINSLGVAQEYQGKLAAARETYGRILTLAKPGTPDHTLALNNIGSVLTKERKYDEATGYYQRAYEASKQPGDLRMWAMSAFNAGHMAEALALVDRWFVVGDAASHGGRYMAIEGYLMALAVPGAAKERYLALAQKNADADWPAPCVAYLAGMLTEDALLSAAKTNDQQTEARTYVGFKRVFSGDNGGLEQLRWVAANGNPHYVETDHAIAYLVQAGNAVPARVP
jgi:tetratricopeptide (TPR) repeat protein